MTAPTRAAAGPTPVRPAPGARAVPARLAVLACPAPLCPHVEFAAAAVLGVPVPLRWVPQPALPGQLQARAELTAPAGTAGLLVSRLQRLGPLRFEVVEGPAPGVDTTRWCHDPHLGLHTALLSAAGEVVVPEGPLRAALGGAAGDAAGAASVAHAVSRLLGDAWDEALEPLRAGGHGTPVTPLRRTG